MKKLKLTKFVACTLTVASILALNPIGANAKWEANRDGKWYSEGDSWATGWRNIDESWYYFGSDGYMKKGWTKVNSTWYYLGYAGEMYTGWVYDNSYQKWYYLNSDGSLDDSKTTVVMPEEINTARTEIKKRVSANIEYDRTYTKDGVNLYKFYNSDVIDSPPEYYYNSTSKKVFELSQHTLGYMRMNDMYKEDCPYNI